MDKMLSLSLIELFYTISRNGSLSISFSKNGNSNINSVLKVAGNIRRYEIENNKHKLLKQFKKISAMFCDILNKKDILKEIEFFKNSCKEVYIFYKSFYEWVNNSYNTLDKYEEFKIYTEKKFSEFCRSFGEDYTLDNYLSKKSC